MSGNPPCLDTPLFTLVSFFTIKISVSKVHLIKLNECSQLVCILQAELKDVKIIIITMRNKANIQDEYYIPIHQEFLVLSIFVYGLFF